MKKRLTIEELKVESFVTSIVRSKNLRAGQGPDPIILLPDLTDLGPDGTQDTSGTTDNKSIDDLGTNTTKETGPYLCGEDI